MTFEAIEMERRKLKIPMAKLCRAAGLAPRSYERIRTGESQARASTMARLEVALDQCRRGEKALAPKGGRDLVRDRATYRVLLAQMARLEGVNVKAALDHSAQQKATANDDWMKVSKLRDMTGYILNTMAGWTNAEVASAAGVTPPAITNALRKVEDLRGADSELEKILSWVEAAVQ